MIWRIVVAIGVAPALVLIAMGIDETKSSNNLVSPAISPKAPPTRMSDTDSEQDLFETTSLFEINWIESFQTIQSEMSIAMKLPMLRTYLIGTSLSWFFSDMVQCEWSTPYYHCVYFLLVRWECLVTGSIFG